MITHRRSRCRFCGSVLPAWLSVQREPDGAMLLSHLGQRHPTEVGHFLDQMHTTDDIAGVAMQAFEPAEDPGEGKRIENPQN